ncbi:expressed unknown protein [Seminavis robusta]|uniref:Uncharacterized protein n=1 Tax=Seminavis robusta TaxID=568900 RepID=A0A9N8HCJ2_9STRA|nr:expressed unknown protein [Seminavis robusta]|eukprot:Sro220_g090630.1 n/a (292) ;mRNA; r:7755-8630
MNSASMRGRSENPTVNLRRKRSVEPEEVPSKRCTTTKDLSTFITRSLSCMFSDVATLDREDRSSDGKDSLPSGTLPTDSSSWEATHDSSSLFSSQTKKRRLFSLSTLQNHATAASPAAPCSESSTASSSSSIQISPSSSPLPTTISTTTTSSSVVCSSISVSSDSSHCSLQRRRKSRSIGKLSQSDTLFSLVHDIPASSSVSCFDSSNSSRCSSILDLDDTFLSLRERTEEDDDSLSYSDDSSTSSDEDDDDLSVNAPRREESGLWYPNSGMVVYPLCDDDDDEDEGGLFF